MTDGQRAHDGHHADVAAPMSHPSQPVAATKPTHKEKRPPEEVGVLKCLAEWTGLEPATPGVTGRYSNQLNYHSAWRNFDGGKPIQASAACAVITEVNLASPRGFEPLLQP